MLVKYTPQKQRKRSYPHERHDRRKYNDENRPSRFVRFFIVQSYYFHQKAAIDIHIGRLCASLLRALSQQVVVENVPVTNGIIGRANVKGRTRRLYFLVGSAGTHAHSQSIYKNPSTTRLPILQRSPFLLSSRWPELRARILACQQQTTRVHFPCYGELSEYSIRLGCSISPCQDWIRTGRMSRLDREAAISMTEITHSWPRRQGMLPMRWKRSRIHVERSHHRVHRALITRRPAVVAENQVQTTDAT